MKKKSLLLMSVFAAVVTLFAAFGITASAYSGGTGTSSNPYLISNTDDLKELRDNVNKGTTYSGKYFKITSSGSDSTCGESPHL